MREGEYRPLVFAADLANNEYDRLALNLWKMLSEDRRLHGHVSGWVDEDGSGGAFDIGVEQELRREAHLDLVGYGNIGQYESVAGVRLLYGRTTAKGRWDLMYELAFHHIHGLDANRDDLVQQRLRGSLSIYRVGNWDVYVFGEVVAYDKEISWSAGFTWQKGF